MTILSIDKLESAPAYGQSNNVTVSFYLAPWLWPAGVDRAEDIPDDWLGHGWSHGCWIVRTYQELSAIGYSCRLTKIPPDSGIVITYRNCLSSLFLGSYWSWAFPRRGRLVVCVRGDRARHHWAQVHISQNQLQNRLENRSWLPNIINQRGNSYYIPHWPLNHMLPRDSVRGSCVENVVFFGNLSQLAYELLQPSWENFLTNLGMKWRIINDLENCRDYSEVDVVIAIRDFSNRSHIRKPSWKILNAWFAEALVITSLESSSRELRESEYDFISVESYQELQDVMRKLAAGVIDYQRYISHARIRREVYSPKEMSKRWIALIEDKLRPEFNSWISSGVLRYLWFIFFRSLEWGWLSMVGIVTYLRFTWLRIRHKDI